MASPAIGRESDKFMLRLPDGMRERIAEAAKANNRSMNAEIVSRLEASFEPRQPGFDGSSTLYVLLDTDGMPISWNEMMTHLDRVTSSLKVHSISALVLTPEVVSSSGREKQTAELAEKYAALQRRAAKERRTQLARGSTT